MEEEKLAEALPPKAKFSWLRIGKIILAAVVLAAAAFGVWFAVNSSPVKAAWASMVYNKHEIYLDCYGLPFYPEVQKALNAHSDVVEKLKLLGAKQVIGEERRCKGWDGGLEFVKGDILITYNSREQRMAIEKLIGNNFFGIPYKGEPVK